jgi:hypothetical protein
MLINKIFLKDGQIALREQLDSEKMNPVVMRKAEQVLVALRAAPPGVSAPLSLPDGSAIALSLGTTRSAHYGKLMRDDWQKRHPESDPAEYEIIRKQLEEEDRRTTFGLTHQGIRAHYRLVPIDTPEGDAGILSMVAGTSRRTGALEESRIARVAQEIVDFKPAFIPPSVYVQSVGGDHFAVAMLIADSLSLRKRELTADAAKKDEDAKMPQ